MSPPPDDAKLREILNPVWFNTYLVKNAIGLYEGVTKHAAALDAHSHFFALVQQFSLDAAALGICKLFDRSNPNFQKNTVPELMQYLTIHLTDYYLVRVDIALLEVLGLGHMEAKDIFVRFRQVADLTKAKGDMMSLIKSNMPNKNDPALARLLKYRNKYVAHQERVNDAVKEQLAYLPSLDEMSRINEWATNFCQLVMCLLTNESLSSNGPSARIAALHVVAKVLGKNFDSSISMDGAAYDEYEAFFKP